MKAYHLILTLTLICISSPMARAADVTPVGTWTWFNKASLIFNKDYSVWMSKEVGKWRWTNKSKLEFDLEWSNGLTDNLKLSPTGKAMAGFGYKETPVTAIRSDAAADGPTEKASPTPADPDYFGN